MAHVDGLEMTKLWALLDRADTTRVVFVFLPGVKPRTARAQAQYMGLEAKQVDPLYLGREDANLGA